MHLKISPRVFVQTVDAGWKNTKLGKIHPVQSPSQTCLPGCWDTLIPFHKGDIFKELKGRFFHADGSAAPCIAAITRFLKEQGQRRGEVQCSVEKSGYLIRCPCHSELSHPMNLSWGHVLVTSSSVPCIVKCWGMCAGFLIPHLNK